MEEFLKLFTPENYELKLDINKDTEELKGSVVITGEPHSVTIKLHAVDMTIDEVEGFDWTYEDNVLTVQNVSCETVQNRDLSFEDRKLGRTALSVSEKDKSCFAISVKFHKKLNHNMQGCYVSTYQLNGKTEKIVSTQFESHYARECFPCIDEPAAKATFDVTITTHDDNDTILFNTEKISDNHFAKTPKMSTYLLAFVIGKLEKCEGKTKDGLPVCSYCTPNHDKKSLKFANDCAIKALEYYNEKFGIKYPLNKMDQVGIPDFEAGAMENWGLVTYRESMFLADEAATADTKQTIALTVTHELSHQWFGNLVTMKWWDDLWLNESFASVIEYYATDAIYPEFHAWEDFFTSDCLAALKRDCLPGVQSVQQPVHHPEEIATLFDGAIVYAKGAHLMLMLIRTMGEDKFFKGIKDYFAKYQYQNTCGDDLWQSLQAYADFDVKDFMHAWISQSGYPVITDEEQQRFLINNQTDDTKWPLPEIKNDMSGHYIINLTDAELSKMLNNFDDLSLEQKLRLLIDRMLLAKTDLASSASLIDLVAKFENETSSAVWEIVTRIICELKIFFPYHSDEQRKYQKFIAKLIRPNLNRLGLEPRKNEPLSDTRLRNNLLSLARYAEDLEILEPLAKLYNEDFTKINSEIRVFVMMAEFYLNENQHFNEFVEKYQQISDPEQKDNLFVTFTDARESENVAKLLKLLNEPDIVKPQDHLHLYLYLRRNYSTKEETLDWLFANWNYVKDIAGEKSIEDYPRYTATTIRTREEADKFYQFFSQFESSPVLSRAISVARTEIESRLKLIERDAPEIIAKINLM